jgi:hypothetical protein
MRRKSFEDDEKRNEKKKNLEQERTGGGGGGGEKILGHRREKRSHRKRRRKMMRLRSSRHVSLSRTRQGRTVHIYYTTLSPFSSFYFLSQFIISVERRRWKESFREAFA